jgi:hypothetical protein
MFAYNTYKQAQIAPVAMQSQISPTDAGFLEFDANLSTPNLNAKYIKFNSVKNARHILITDTNPEYMICQEQKPGTGTGTGTGTMQNDRVFGIYHKDTGCITHKGRADQYNIIETNYQFTWSPTLPKYPMYNICGVDVVCVKPISQTNTLDSENIYAKQFVYDPTEGFIRPIGSTNLCVATDKESERYIFLAECSDTRVLNRWICTSGETEIRLRDDPSRRIAYEISDNGHFTRVFLTDLFPEDADIYWIRDVETQLFKTKTNNLAMGVHKITGTYKQLNNNYVCQIASEYNNIVDVWSNISFLKKEFTNSLTHKSAIINPFKNKTRVEGKDKYTDRILFKGPTLEGFKFLVNQNGFVQLNMLNNNFINNEVCSEQYKTIFYFETIKSGVEKYFARSVRIHILIYSLTESTKRGFVSYDASRKKFIVDFAMNRHEDYYIFFVRGPYNQPIFYPKTDRSLPLTFPFECIGHIEDSNNCIFPYDDYITCWNCWSYALPRTFKNPVNSRQNISKNLIPNYFAINVYSFTGRYLKEFETKDRVIVGIRNGQLIYSPDQTPLYYLPTGLSTVSMWKNVSNTTPLESRTYQQIIDLAEEYLVPNAVRKGHTERINSIKALGFPSAPGAFGKHVMLQDITNNCVWIVNNTFPPEWNNLYPLQPQTFKRIMYTYTGTGIPPGKEDKVDNSIFYFGTSEDIFLSAYDKQHLNLFGSVYRITYDKLYKAPDSTLWFDLTQATDKGMYKIIYKIYKSYTFTKEIIVSGKRTIVEDTSIPPIPYMFRRFMEITYQGNTISLPMGIRYKGIGIYNDTYVTDTYWRDDYGYDQPPIPIFEDMKFIIQNALNQASISISDDALEFFTIVWLKYMDLDFNRYNISTLGNYINYVYKRTNKKSWIINDIVNITPDQNI